MSVYVYVFPGTSIHPEAMMHPPVSDVPPIFQKCSDSVKNFLNFTPFPEIFFHFHPPKFLMTFFSHQIFPYFPCDSVHFPLFRKIIILPPAFINFPSVFQKFTCFLHSILYVYFVSPLLWPWCIYASPNARIGRLYSAMRLSGPYFRFHVFVSCFHISACIRRDTL